MRGSIAIIAALFCNFFGWAIIQKYEDSLASGYPSPFAGITHQSTALMEMFGLFCLCALYYWYRCKRGGRRNLKERGPAPRGLLFKGLSAFLVVVCAFKLATMNLSLDTALRGVGQFERSLGTSLQRVELLILPTFIYYRTRYRETAWVRAISLMAIICIAMNGISHGDRRDLFYYGFSYFFIVVRERHFSALGVKETKAVSGRIIAAWIVVLAVSAIAIRSAGGEQGAIVGRTLLQGTVGSLGLGGILPEVQYLVENKTGFLYGATFVTYAWSLFVPSFVLYAVGLDEFTHRSQGLFDGLFSGNPDHGNDFMMLADFYWNFGYFGYAMYLAVTFWVIRRVVENERAIDDKKFGLCLILAVFFIAGQRADFGAFVKPTVYCGIVYAALIRLGQGRMHTYKVQGGGRRVRL